MEAAGPDRHLTAQGQERKQQLLDCAAALFAERGYADTRVKDIVDAAGVAKGLFYWYFENKEALFAELVDNIRLRLRQSQARAMDRRDPVLVQLRQGTEASVHFMAQHAQFFSLLEVESGEGAEVGRIRRRGTEQHLGDVERLLRVGQAEGVVVDEDPTLLAIGVIGAVGYFSHYHRTGRIRVPIDELARFVADSVVRAVAVGTPVHID